MQQSSPFEVIGVPNMRGRVTPVRGSPPKQEQEKPVDIMPLIKACVLSELKEVPQLEAGLNEIPFNEAKTLAYLKYVKLYLTAQLRQIDNKIQEIQEKQLQ